MVHSLPAGYLYGSAPVMTLPRRTQARFFFTVSAIVERFPAGAAACAPVSAGRRVGVAGDGDGWVAARRDRCRFGWGEWLERGALFNTLFSSKAERDDAG